MNTYLWMCKYQFRAELFQGNQCRRFLKLVDTLEKELMGECGEAILNGLPYIHAFRTFDHVVSTCFSVTLKEGYRAAIQEFRSAYLGLGMTVTPQVYISLIYPLTLDCKYYPDFGEKLELSLWLTMLGTCKLTVV